MVVPYDYPDQYTNADAYSRHWYGRNVILKGIGNHWRSVTASTVTYAVRLHVLRDVLRLRGERGMPGPLYFAHDYKESLFLSSTLGIFAPMPALSSHRHRDLEQKTHSPQIVSPDFPIARYDEELRTLAARLGFPTLVKSPGSGGGGRGHPARGDVRANKQGCVAMQSSSRPPHPNPRGCIVLKMWNRSRG
mmetsp:Transcript_45906/g.103412  ORF Transcript_45906/g.103412 Transcript_45906/m.103412 type:complete len:191 (-) Transcript_45906:122-694(-)